LKKTILIILLIFIFCSCKKDVPPVKETFNGNISTAERVFICNEGNFQFNNASISLYDPQTGNVIADIYKPNNNNQSIGDVCQSLYWFNQKIYAVLNNSGKVVVVNENDYNKTGQISNLTSPRYFLPISNSTAYVSDLYSNSISIVDLNSLTKIGSISCSGWTEEMVLSFGKVFVCNLKKDYLYVIQTSTNQITDSINVGYGSTSIVKDKNEKLWVACTGDSLKNSLPKLVCINPISNHIEKTFSFPYYSQSPSQLKINSNGDQLYFLNKNIYKMTINDVSLPQQAFINSGNKLFYALGINPKNENIYVSDAIDYVQRGKINIYNQSGTLQNSFNAGIIPGNIIFN
jgi:YVTN family beta-propeller protein